MAGAVIGALRVVLGADTAAFESGLRKSERSLAAWQRSVTGLGAIVTAVAGGAFLAFVKNAAKVGDEIGETAQRLGMNAEAFQELAFAAKLANVEQEEFAKALDIFNKKLGDFKGGVTGAQSGLGQLGLRLADIKALKPEEAFRLVADRIAAIPDPMRRAAIEAELFGKTGMKLDGVLRLGAAGLSKLALEARRMGLILSTETINKASEADDEFDRMGQALRVAGINIAVGFLPALTELRKIITSQEFQDGTREVARRFGDFIKLLVDNREIIAGAAAAFAGWRIGSIAGPLGGATMAIGAFVAAAGKSKDELKLVEDALDRTIDRLNSWRAIAAGTAINLTPLDPNQEVKKLEESARALTERLNELRGSSEALKVTVNKPVEMPWMSPEVIKATEDLAFKTRILKGEFDRLAEGFPELAKSLNVPLAMIGTSAASLNPLLQALNAEMLRFKGAQLTQELLDPWAKYEQQLVRINELLAAGAISQETYGRAAQKAAGDAMQSQQQFASEAASAITTIFKNNKAASIAAAIINTAVAVTKALSAYPPPWSFIMAGLQAAAGAAQIAAIKAQKMQMGGSFTIPGGRGGGDVVPVSFMAEPGERVRVEPNSGPGGGGATPINIALRSEGFTRADVIKLITSINDLTRDGYRLNVAPA